MTCCASWHAPLQCSVTLGQAGEWLATETAAMGGKKPIDLCDTFEGRGLVRDAIRRIDYGEFP